MSLFAIHQKMNFSLLLQTGLQSSCFQNFPMLYSFLKQDAISLWKPGLYNKKSPMPFRYSPILRLRTGGFAPAYISDALNVFYSSIDADGDVNVIDPVLLENKTSKSFFDELGLKEIDKADYIKKILINVNKK